MSADLFNAELYREHNENEFKKVTFICDKQAGKIVNIHAKPISQT